MAVMAVMSVMAVVGAGLKIMVRAAVGSGLEALRKDGGFNNDSGEISGEATLHSNRLSCSG